MTKVELVWPGTYNERGERRVRDVPRLPLVREMVCCGRLQRGGYQPTGTPVDLTPVQPPRQGTAAYTPGRP